MLIVHCETNLKVSVHVRAEFVKDHLVHLVVPLAKINSVV